MTYDLTEVGDARKYIAWAAKHLLNQGDSAATYVLIGRDRYYHFNELSDDDAILVANRIWLDIHKQTLGH